MAHGVEPAPLVHGDAAEPPLKQMKGRHSQARKPLRRRWASAKSARRPRRWSPRASARSRWCWRARLRRSIIFLPTLNGSSCRRCSTGSSMSSRRRARRPVFARRSRSSPGRWFPRRSTGGWRPISASAFGSSLRNGRVARLPGSLTSSVRRLV